MCIRDSINAEYMGGSGVGASLVLRNLQQTIVGKPIGLSPFEQRRLARRQASLAAHKKQLPAFRGSQLSNDVSSNFKYPLVENQTFEFTSKCCERPCNCSWKRF
eukprot:TRINITY_DN5397_c0_g1_i1.p1 TRINITY_DN5397_c0_g1~~TRINITY_DN5397_c0_g1_i1.p1  ORF type:complete len:104 (-),score=8.11 TRINITY_DN5397_c0_g1_i1:102-413(-)